MRRSAQRRINSTHDGESGATTFVGRVADSDSEAECVEVRVEIHEAGFAAAPCFSWHARQSTTPLRLHTTQMNVPQSWHG